MQTTAPRDMGLEIVMENTIKFALALAYVNCGKEVDVSDIDMYGICDPDQVVTSQETVEQFQSARGGALGGVEKTPFGDVRFWRNVQAEGKGSRRGTLYLMDCDTERCAYFSA